MSRHLQGTATTLYATLYRGSTPDDPVPDEAECTVLRADGTTLTTVTATPVDTGPEGVFAATLTAAEAGLLDRLTAQWAVTFDGQPSVVQTYHEIVGGFLCPLVDLKAEFPDAADVELMRIRTVAEQRLESAIGRACVPRYAYERHTARRRLRVSHPPVRSVRSLSVDGYAYGVSALAALVLADSTVYLSSSPSRWYGPVVIGYEHGEDFPSEVVREAVKLVAKETFTTDADGRVIRREADGQAVTYASPSSGGGFMDPTLRAMVRDLATPLVA